MIFKNEYDFLSNMSQYNMIIVIQGVPRKFHCAESAFLASKHPTLAHLFEPLSGHNARALDKKLSSPIDWNKQQLQIMYNIVTAKFEQNPELIQRLCNIKQDIVEDNTWGDTFWGKCNGIGQNNLGKILMRIRDSYELRN